MKQTLSEAQMDSLFIKTTMKILKDKNEQGLGLELIKRVKRLEQNKHKQVIKELLEEVKEIEWDKKWEKEYKGIAKRLFQEHNVSVKRLNKIIKQKTGELE